jgi:DNA primase
VSIIDDVKQKTDIVEVIGQYVTLRKSGRNLSAPCPFHEEKNPSFFVYPERQSWHCFGACNTGGDVFSFIMKKENLEFGDALRLLAERAGIVIPDRIRPDEKKDEKDRIFEMNSAASLYFHGLLLNSPAAEPARKYLQKRKLNEKTVRDFQLGYSLDDWGALKKYLMDRGYSEKELVDGGLLVQSEDGRTHDRFRNRLMFTICDSRGRVTGFGARVLDDSLPKYVNSPQTLVFDKSGTLFAINLASPSIRRLDQAVMMEGYMDVITAHQNGITNVVASMGTAITDKQVNDLKKLTKNIVLSLDADSAGEEAMLRCVDYENTFDIELNVVVLPEGKDPDDVIREHPDSWQEFLQKAIPVVDFSFDMVSAKLDLTKAGDKRTLVDKVGPVVSSLKNPVRRGHYIQKLARLAGVNENAIQASLGAAKAAPSYRPQPQPQARRTGRATVKTLLSKPVEEQFLAFLLKHPEFSLRSRDIPLDYFENSENRQIFIAWQETTDIDSLRNRLDSTLVDYLDTLVMKNVLATKTEERYNNYVLRLKEDYLRSMARKGETFKTAGELPDERDLELTDNLREIFHRRAGREGSKGEKK